MWDVRQASADAVACLNKHLGVELHGDVAELLNDQNYMVRKTACEALLHGVAVEQIEVVVGSLRDASWQVRLAAVKTIASFGDAGHEFSRELVKLIDDRAPLVRGAVAKALALLPDAHSYAGIIASLLMDPQPHVRCDALEAISRLGEYGQALAAEVAAHLQDPSQEARIVAREVLCSFGKSGLVHLQGYLPADEKVLTSGRAIGKDANIGREVKDWGLDPAYLKWLKHKESARSSAEPLPVELDGE